jgi:hypothetical protein
VLGVIQPLRSDKGGRTINVKVPPMKKRTKKKNLEAADTGEDSYLMKIFLVFRTLRSKLNL